MSRTTETKHIEWHETCKCKCRQRLNEDKCRCECKELIGKGVCDKGFIWNPSNCKCRKKLVDKLIEECTESVKEEKVTEITFCENKNKHKCSFCTLYIVLFSVIFTINIGIGTHFVY